MLLSHDELVQLVAEGVVRNVDKSQINAASIDVRLGGKVLVETPQHGAPVLRLGKRETPHMTSMPLPYRLMPGEFVLAATMEEFWLPNNIAAQFQLKSSGARMGLEHLKAGWCDPGWHGSKLTLELKNVLTHSIIELNEGDKVGQLVFFRCAPVPGHASYAARGHYNGDAGAQTAKLAER